jgi:hypothetical protein
VGVLGALVLAARKALRKSGDSKGNGDDPPPPLVSVRSNLRDILVRLDKIDAHLIRIIERMDAHELADEKRHRDALEDMADTAKENRHIAANEAVRNFGNTQAEILDVRQYLSEKIDRIEDELRHIRRSTSSSRFPGD